MSFDFIKARVIGITAPVVDFIPDAQGIISYAARVSNPKNQHNFKTAEGLLKYCVEHKHFSVFETVNILMDIEVPRDISRQVLRHASARFQEFSQRYADVTDEMFCVRELRGEDTTNRQNSVEGMFSQDDIAEWENDQQEVISLARSKIKKWRERKAAKECTRVFLPEGLTMSHLYMNGTVRTWLHYCDLRGGNGTQKEHVDLAVKCKQALVEHMPFLTSVWNDEGVIT